MTEPDAVIATTDTPDEVPVRLTAAQRRALPSYHDAAVAVAEKYSQCTRPVIKQRVDTDTGEVVYVGVPCGNTRESVCAPCAKKARALRVTQCREGWHADREPVADTTPPTGDQVALAKLRADLADAYRQSRAEDDQDAMEELRTEIHSIEDELRASGWRGRFPPLEPTQRPARAQRSTRRRQDVPDLPRRKVARRTLGMVYAGRYQPSMFITLTMPSYGRINPDGGVDDHDRPCSDGTPRDPDSYDYRRAARDIVHFSALFDRWVQNLRRAVGWDVQYFATVEPQRRVAPHLHMLMRGTETRALIKQVTAGTYHQVWWPRHDELRYSGEHMPVWDDHCGTFVDPLTGEPLTGWADALAALDKDPAPAHVVRFGEQVDRRDIRGVLGGSDQAGKTIGYVTKYLTKSVAETLDASTARQQTHHARLLAELERTPCSPKCPVWLRYGVVPLGASARTDPSRCKGKAHRADTLGLPGRRVLVSRKWSGKTLPDHQADRGDFVRQLLADVGIVKPVPKPGRYVWLNADPTDPHLPHRDDLLMSAVAQLTRWRSEYDMAALAKAAGPPGTQNNSATGHTAA